MNSTELAASSVNLTNSIVFSAGCHSGYNIVNGDAVAERDAAARLDARRSPQKGATLIAGTGYQYGDTDFLAYSEQLYADFAHALRLGSGPGRGRRRARAGEAGATSTTRPSLRGIDAKALLESTLFGLPMLSVNLPPAGSPGADDRVDRRPTTRRPRPTRAARSASAPADVTLTPTLTTNTRQLVRPERQRRVDRDLPHAARRRRHEPRRSRRCRCSRTT